MKLSSLQYVGESFYAAVKRFPLSLLGAFVGTVSAILLTELSAGNTQQNGTVFILLQHWMVFKLLLCCFLAVPLFFSAKIFSERLGKHLLVLNVFCSAVLVMYYFLLPDNTTTIFQQELTRFFILVASAHCLVAIAPFIGKREPNGFWQYNRILFIRFLTATLFSAVLYGGIALSVLSIDKLFDVKVEEKLYLDLWFIFAGIVHSTFFFAGVPASLEQLEADRSYPKAISVFAQFVLLPLVGLYLIILYGYGIKILISWNLPIGWVSNLIIPFSIIGTLAFLLVAPLKESASHSWVKIFLKWFYVFLLPILFLLAVSIGKRLSDYGVTEERYFISIVALWLFGVALYFIFSKAKSIKVIPATLCIVTLLISFGPWGAFAVSKRSQQYRLETLMSKNGKVNNGKFILTSVSDVSFSDRKQISSCVAYLYEMHGKESLANYFDDSLNTMMASEDVTSTVRILCERMGVNYVSAAEQEYAPAEMNYTKTYAAAKNQIPAKQYDWILTLGEQQEEFFIDNKKYVFSYKPDTRCILVYKDGVLVKTVDVLPIVKKLIEQHPSDNAAVPSEEMMLQADIQDFSAKFYFQRISVTKMFHDSLVVSGLGDIIVFLKK